jgi:hypothetical protein
VSDGSPQRTSELGIIWYVLPVFWAMGAVAGLLFLSHSAAEMQPSEVPAAVSAKPFGGTQLGVPSASAVFTTRTWEASEVVEQF